MANERLNPFGVDAYSKAETDAKLTPAALLSEILKADGASSGLDADLLDGQHANAFAAAGHTHTRSQITDFGSYAAPSHTHTKNQITDFTHTHTRNQITDFGSWAAASHTHTRSQITDFGSWLPTGGGTLTGNLIFNNNLGIYGKTTGGANAQLIRLNSSNRIEIGTEGTSPALGGTEIHGGSFIKLTPEISASTSIPSIFIDKQSNTLIYLRPTTAGGADLGDQTYHYRYLYCQNEIHSSDERMKHDIQNMEDFKMVSPALEADVEQKTAIEVFFENLQPKVFSFNNEEDELENQQKHFGFIAQDVEQAMNLIGLDNFTSGFLKHGVRKIAENGEEPIESSGYSVEDYAHLGEEGYTDNYGLAYSEFIAVNTYMIKKCLKKIEELEKEVEALKNNG